MFGFGQSQLPAECDLNLSGKIIVITGGNSGIGLPTSIFLAKCGAELILAVRSSKKTNDALELIRSRSESQKVSHLNLDLSLLKDVERFAEEFSKKYDRLDILINNAGAVKQYYNKTKDGLEWNFQVNFLSHFSLTLRLLPLLRKANKARIIHVSSEAHASGNLNWDDLQFENGNYGWFAAYGRSKLCNIMFSNHLQKFLASKDMNITSNSLHPGFILTDIGRDGGFFYSLIKPILMPFSISQDKGADTTCWVATAPQFGIEGGLYLNQCKIGKTRNRLCDDVSAQEKLWKISCQLTDLNETNII